ncbi:dihydrofolate reductase, partial [Escherichia coli]|nr:dihydrofolate reductase [Escherichia coli]
PSTAWTSAHDRKFFVEETKKYGVLIMGRNTYKTIGKPLPGRLIIVLTEKPEEINVVPGSVETAQGDLRTIVDDIEKRGYSSLVVAGGA